MTIKELQKRLEKEVAERNRFKKQLAEVKQLIALVSTY